MSEALQIAANCRVCRNPLGDPVLSLGNQPLANAYIKREDLSKPEPVVPLMLSYCPICELPQLAHIVNPKLMFTNYVYVSGTTSTLKQHFDEFTNSYIGCEPLRVLDIGCNDGTFLASWDKRHELFGVDPAENLYHTALKNCPEAYIVCGFWGTNAVRRHIPEKSFDIITAFNVFAHVDDIKTFLSDCERALHINGTLFIEMPYLGTTLRHGEFDQIYHEHLSYFSFEAMYSAAYRNGFVIIDIEYFPNIHGGSMRYKLRKRESLVDEFDWNDERLLLFRERESQDRINRKFIDFIANTKVTKNLLETIVDENWHEGIQVVGYGASAKGNTVLNYCNDMQIKYIVDDNPLKVGLFTPGRRVEIMPVEQLAKEDCPLAIVLFAWNFKDEILKKIKAQRGTRPTYIIDYVPSVQCNLLD